MWNSTNTRVSLKGQVFADRYQIESEIGRGGMGIVYRALDLAEQRPVAIKTLLYADTYSEKTIRFQREFRAISRLHHPNVVQVYHSGREYDQFFYVMELVSGYGFKEFFNFSYGQPFDFSNFERVHHVLLILQQMCDALQYIHANRIVHRDLKPENIIIHVDPDTNRTAVKILDFGLVQDLDANMQLTREGIPLGTVAYMSPEQAKGGTIDHRSDVYTLGVMLFELITGRLPFEGNNPFSVMLNHASQEPAKPSEFCHSLPEQLESIILKMLAKEPNQRYHSAFSIWSDIHPIFTNWDLPTIDLTRTDDFIYAQKYPVFAPVLIGRDPVWESLQTALDISIQNKQGAGYLLAGELGAGKSRLINELRIKAHIKRIPFLIGQCRSQSAAPYEPFITILTKIEELMGQDPRYGSIAEQAKHQVGELKDLLGNAQTETARLNWLLTQNKEDVIKAFLQILRHCAQVQPFILVVEDLHWADLATWELISILMSSIANNPFHLIASYRLEDIQDNPLYQKISQLDSPQIHRLHLKALSIDEIGKMISSMLGQDISDEPGLLKRIYQQTSGNPFFVGELVKALVDRGRLFRTSDRWVLQAADPSKVTIPHSVNDAVTQRLMQLKTPERQFLDYASVWGTTFTLKQIQSLIDLAENDLVDRLDNLLKSYMIVERDSGRYFEFSHVMIQTIVHENLSDAFRHEMHTRVISFLQAEHNLKPGFAIYRHHPSIELASQMAFHCGHAGLVEQAVYHYLVAASWSARNFAGDDAGEFFDQARMHLDTISEGEVPDPLKFALLVVEGDVFGVRMDTPAALAKFESAADLLGPESDVVDRMSIRRDIANILYKDGDLERAIQLYREVLDICQQAPQAIQLWHRVVAIIALGVIQSTLGRYRESIDNYLTALELIETHHVSKLTFQVRLNLGNIYDKIGDLEQAELNLMLAQVEAEKTLEIDQKAHVMINLGRIKGMRGKLAEAAEHFDEAGQYFKELGHEAGQIFSKKMMGEIYYEKALLAKARDAHMHCVERSTTIQHAQLILTSRINVIQDLLATCDFDEVEEQFYLVEEVVERFQKTIYHRNVLILKAEYLIAIGAFDELELLWGELSDNFTEELLHNAAGDVHLSKAKAALAQNEYDLALELLSIAQESFTDVYHLYVFLESAILHHLLNATLNKSEEALTQLETDLERLITAEGQLRLVNILDVIFSHKRFIVMLSVEAVETLLWSVQEEIDVPTCAGLHWKAIFFEARYLRDNPQMQIMKMSEATKKIIQIAKKIDDSDRRQAFLNLPCVQDVFATLFALKKRVDFGTDLRRIEFFLKKNKAMPM